jgi:hypothetical protein
MKNTKKAIAAVSILGLVGMLIVYSKGFAATPEATVAATVTVRNIALSVADGTVAYGTLDINATQNTCTTAPALNDPQTITNTGNVAQNFLVRGTNSANWTLGSPAGSNIYEHRFVSGACATWPTPAPGGTALTTVNATLATNIAAGATTILHLRINTPTATTFFTAQTVNVIVVATAF